MQSEYKEERKRPIEKEPPPHRGAGAGGFVSGAARGAGRAAGLFMLGNINQGDPRLAQHFDILTPENSHKPATLAGTGFSAMNLAAGNAVMDYASGKGMKVHGSALVMGHDRQGQVGYLNGESTQRAEAKLNLGAYIKKVVQHFDACYPGAMASWDVASGLLAPSVPAAPPAGFDWRDYARPAGEDRWRLAYGKGMAAGERDTDYIYDAFVFAREHTGAALYYDDANLQEPGKAAVVAAMVAELNGKYAQEQPLGPDSRQLVEGVGMRFHASIQGDPAFADPPKSAFAGTPGLSLTAIGSFGDAYPHAAASPASARSLEGAIQAMIAAGVAVSINALDLQVYWPCNANIRTAPGVSLACTEKNQMTPYWQSRVSGGAELEEIQALRYAEYFAVLKKYAHYVERATIWGLDDTGSWRPHQKPLLWDSAGSPKASLGAVSDPEGWLGIGDISPFATKGMLAGAMAGYGALAPHAANYDPLLWAAAQAAYAGAQTALAAPLGHETMAADLAALDAAYRALQGAMAALGAGFDLSALAAALGAAAGLAPTDYTEGSWGVLQDAVGYANGVAAWTSQQMVDDAAGAIQSAISNLVAATFGLGNQPPSVVLRKGMSYQLNIDSNNHPSLLYISSNQNATVSATGLVKAEKTGSALITVVDVWIQQYITITINITN
ncbi:MAG: endo-1,4-beta-xylanase [Oscillospiraceae bacterium]|nr:endo-1,4-beta-xylanase [Oscillospiraceae bacterium]